MILQRILIVTLSLFWAAQASALGHNEQQCRANIAGTFSHYKLAVSRAKEWCFANVKSNDPQCAREYTVHGLWPQCEAGYPADCVNNGAVEDPVDSKQVLTYMPSKFLIKHEWEKHGRCSGLKRSQYFTTLGTLYRNLHLPALRAGKYTQAQLIKLLTQQQPGLSPEHIELACDENARAPHASRATLDEIRICYGRDGKFAACTERESSCARLPQIEVRF